jgi:UDP-N-acetylglucosamine 4,6-dehydratase
MKAAIPDPRVRYVIGDVRDPLRILDACRGVEIVIHAAAQKRVEVCESDPNESVLTNIVGTQNVARACIERGVRRAVVLSTDKAAAPATLYGACKLVAERVWLASNVYSAGTPTRFAATRYGNVLNSTGSVVPMWQRQASGGQLSVTDLRMTRFWMAMQEAVDLVVLALGEMRGGEVFVPRIRGARVIDLAHAVAPGCAAKVVGIRPGEKLHEVLITDDEARRTYDCLSHYVIEPPARTWGDVAPPNGTPVPIGFTYWSDSAEQFSADALRELVAA